MVDDDRAAKGRHCAEAIRWLFHDGPDSADRHVAACRTGLSIHGFAQGPSFVDRWHGTTGIRIVVLQGLCGEMPILSLPLQLRRRHGLAIASFCGDSHANGNFPGLAAALGAEDAASMRKALADHARSAAIDLLDLRFMAPQIACTANPLIGETDRNASDIALAANLGDGFDAFLARHSGKRKRKKHRQDRNNLDKIGTVECRPARDPDEIDRMLDTFLEQKRGRFAELGIRDNPFEPAEIRNFLRGFLKDEHAKAQPAFFLEALLLDGEPIAVGGFSRLADRLVCEFSSFRPLDNSISPSIYLFYEVIEREARQGTPLFDFSVGVEPFKRDWCDTQIVQRDRLQGLTAKGRAYAAFAATALEAKRRVKASDRLTGLYRKLRRFR